MTCRRVVQSIVLLFVLLPVLSQVEAQAGAADAEVTVLAEGLNQPWSVAELPNGDLLITEKPGRLLHRSADGKLASIAGAPEVFHASQGGLLDVLVDPDFASNQRIFLSWADGNMAANRTTVASAVLRDAQLVDLEILLAVSPVKAKAAHFGGKLALLPDGTLLLSVGEGFEYRELAQSLDAELGKILRIQTDGRPAADNPFPEQAPRVYTYGHRNPQGLAVDPETGTVWMHEHGPRGGDELNRVIPGTNYGWPAITYGVDYSGQLVSPFSEAPGMAQPVTWWVPSIAPSGLAVYRGEQFPEWQGDLLLGALVDRKLYRLDMEGGEVIGQSEPFPEISGRVRDVRVTRDGTILALTDEGKLYRVRGVR